MLEVRPQRVSETRVRLCATLEVTCERASTTSLAHAGVGGADSQSIRGQKRGEAQKMGEKGKASVFPRRKLPSFLIPRRHTGSKDGFRGFFFSFFGEGCVGGSASFNGCLPLQRNI